MTGPRASGGAPAERASAPSILQLDGGTGAGRELLGGKAWSIERLRGLGIDVPPAFVLTTEVCRRFYDRSDGAGSVPDDVWTQMPAALAELERITGRTFGGGDRPLLVSVRSGAAISMPGMMDTVLNLGMTDEVRGALAEESGDAEYAADTQRRFLEQFEKVVGQPAPADPWTSCGSPWRRCSSPGSPPGRSPTGATGTSPATWGRRSPCRPWCSATSTSAPAPACCSAATRWPGARSRTASGCPEGRVRTSCPGG